MTIVRDRRFTPARADLAAESLRGLVSAPRYVAPRVMRVVAELAPLTRAPSVHQSIDTQALHGEDFDIYDIDGEGWAWGQSLRDGYVGYLPARALSENDRAATHRARAPRTFVYPEPNIKTPPAMALPLGARLVAGGDSGAFLALDGGGFVWRAHLSAIHEAEADFVAVAERFLHAPYLWGGKTVSGLDCSGLVQISLDACGLAAPRDTDVMEKALGAPLADFSDLRRGDLVFWKGHVGIMRDAGELLHANGHFMQVTSEPLRVARERIAASSSGDITSIRRL